MITLTHYDIREQLYESSNSTVYRAVRGEDSFPVILKVLRGEYLSPERVAWFKREYDVTRRLHMASVVDVYALEEHADLWLMVLEDFGGDSLVRLGVAGQLNIESFLEIAIQLSDTLGEVHQRQIIHKDINPTNIVLNPDSGEVKLIDFGISTVLSREQQTFKNPTLLEGTLAYISPEQTGRMNRAIDYRTDFYSLGVTFYELLTGQLPFAVENHIGDALKVIHAAIAKQPILPHEVKPDIPPILSAIIMKLMAKNPASRYQSALGLQADLERCLEHSKHSKEGTLHTFRFELGQDDFSSQLRLSDKLYGREQELATLLAAFERVSEGATELMLVAGSAGVGKSALVHEVHKPITAKEGYFISGKFDQLQRHIPYSAFTEAFNQFCDYLLTEGEASFLAWQSRILKAVGTNGQVLIDIIPTLEQVIGPQPPVIQVAAQDAQNRFNLYFQFFIRAITDTKHPLVIFIDDLQWADQASLKLLKLLLANAETHHLLVIGAYRDNEVQAAHAFSQLLHQLEKAKTVINRIQVQNLKQEDVCALLADSLSCKKDICQPLATLLYQKTLGNAFFVSQFLHSLYEDGFLSFDSHKRQWQWQMSAIEELSISENVVDLMVSKIGKLPPATQKGLQLAACLGHRFDLESLAIIAKQTVTHTWKATSESAATLQPALQEGLLIPLDEAYKLVSSGITLALPVRYKFVHDRIQQAAYSLIPEPQKKRLHLQIARLLLARYASYADGLDKRVKPTPELDVHLFEIVNQFNAGLPSSMMISQSDDAQSLLSEPLEVPLIAHLNLLAGQKAKGATAYQLAWTYLQTGIRLLESESWRRQSMSQGLSRRRRELRDQLWREEYNLALSLYLEGAEAAYLCAEFAPSTALVQQILQNARKIEHYVKAAEIRIAALTAQGELVTAVEFGLETLKRLGQKVPKNPSLAQLALMTLQTRVTWHGQKPLDLLDSPMMSAREPLLVMRVLSTMIGPLVLVAPKLIALTSILGVRLSRKYGISPVSPLYLVTYGATWCAMMGDIERGYQFGQLAMALLKRLPKPEHSLRTRLAFHTFITHWKEDAHETLPALEALIQDALQVGNFEMASFALLVYVGHGFFTGQTLQGWEEKIERFIKPLYSFEYPPLSSVRLILNLVSALRDETGIPTGKPLEARSLPLPFLSLFEQRKDEFGLLVYYIYESIHCYILLFPVQTSDDSPLASEMLAQFVTQAEKHMIAGSNTMGVPVFCMYASLARLANYPHASPLKKLQYRRKISSNQRKMKKWANHAPMNYLHKYYLVEAERCRVFGKAQEAGKYYEQAIDLAKENKYLNEEALANELAGKFYAARGQKKFAQLYLTEAHQAYWRWGAMAKVKQLEELYPELLSTGSRTAKGQRLSKRSSSQSTSQMTFLENFDLGSFLKASQAISGQLVRSELLAALMQVVIENAGAQVGHLILPALAPEGRVGAPTGHDKWAHPQGMISGRVGEWVPDSSQEWLIVASSSAEGQVVLSETPVSEGGRVSAAIVRYVARKIEPVVLSDALHEGHFTKDPDVVRKQAKSVLCMPLINQGHLRGILYLENNLARDSFTPDRIEVLNLLSSQAAISLENATLYNTLEEKVAERTMALEQEIKERKRAEEAAQSANQAKSSFLANMSHELRSPLNAILGYARILKRQQPVQKQAEIIEQSGQHLLTLINDLLDIARIESGKIELQPQVIDLSKMLQQCVDMMRIRAQHKGISFRYIASPTLPPYVKVDEKRLRQILINLLSNAVKFTPSASKKGKVSFSVLSSQRETSQQGAETTLLFFEIEDNGIGIPTDKLEVIFEPFKQASANDGNGNGKERAKSTLASPGTGLGLTISRHLVALMGGTLRVSSQLGVGSTFSLELRLPIVTRAPQHSVERRIMGFKTEAGTMLRKTLSVLVVDDRWQSRAILADLLSSVGFEVHEAADGQEGVNKALELRPQVVLTDLLMPVLSGIELIRQLRASALNDVVVIAFSASAFSKDKEQTLAAGSNAFLPKPINSAQLFATLQEHLPIEWIYEDLTELREASTGEKASPSSLSNDYQPPTEQISQLLRSAQIGDIQALLRQSEQLLAQEPAAHAFVTELQQLAKAFKMRPLRQWLSSLLEE